MSATTRLGLRYPILSDTADVPRDIGNLASDIDDAAIFGIGTLASRPVSAGGSPGISGRFYYANDLGVSAGHLYFDYGAGWRKAPLYQTDGTLWMRNADADTQPSIKFTPSAAKIEFGAGGSTATDTSLYRASAGQLKTDGLFISASQIYSQPPTNGSGFIYNPASGGVTGIAFQSTIQTEANQRFKILADGSMSWGAGGASAIDTNLYRASANILATDDELRVYGSSGANNYWTISNQTISWNVSGVVDTNLYRSATSTLKTDGNLITSGTLQVGSYTFSNANSGISINGRLTVQDGNIYLGSPGDLFVSRNGTGDYLLRGTAIRTEGTVYPGDNTTNDGIYFRRSVGSSMGNIAILASLIFGEANSKFIVRGDGTHEWGAGGASATDVTLSRPLASVLKIGGPGTTSRYLQMDGGGGIAEMQITTAGDFFYNVNGVASNVLRINRTSAKSDTLQLDQGNVHMRAGAFHIWNVNDSVSTDNFVVNWHNSNYAFSVTTQTTGVPQLGLYSSAGSSLMTIGGSGVMAITWPGGANLYTSTTNFLKTDGSLEVAGQIRVATDNTSKLYFGSAIDTNLYRSTTRTLKTDGNFKLGVDYGGAGTMYGPVLPVTSTAVTDADVGAAVSGLMAVDTTNNKLWIRCGSTWKSVALI